MNGNQRLAMRRLGRRTMTWKAAWFVLAAWLASAAAMLCPVAGAQVVTKTIGITFPQSLQVNPITNKVYVANFTSETSPNNVVVIDGATDSATTVTTGIGAAAVGVNPVTNKIYAANFFDNSVTVIDGATNSTITVATGKGPEAIVVNPVTNKIYVGNATDNTVTVIDGATNTTTTVTAGGTPPDHLINLAVNPVTNKIYVFNDGNGIITVIDGATNSTTLVNVGSAPVTMAVAVNPVTNKIYLANGSNFITVMDGATNSTTTVATGNAPSSIAVNPATNKIYVANFADNDVTVIDGATNSTIATVATNANPNEVAVDPLTNQIFVGQFDADTVVIDGNTNTATNLPGTLSVGEIAVNPVTNKVYCISQGTVLVIDPAIIAKTLVPVEPFNPGPLSIAANAATNKIYIPNSNNNDVTVIDGATNTSTTVATGSVPVAVEVNPVTNKIYVADNGDNTVTVIDGATNSTITVASGSAPTAVAVNPVTDKIYVANGDNTVTVIDGITNSTTTVAAGGQPGAVAVNPVTNKIYVANFSSNNITVIDGATNSTASVSVGAPPQALAVNPVTNKVYVANLFDIAVIDGATNATTTFGNIGALLVEVNPITNKIYFATGFNSLMVLDGATNTIQTVTVPNSLTLANLAVNSATNKIYLADSDFSNVTVIDGATNTIIATIPTTLVFGIGLAVNPTAVNPVTDTVYLAAGNVNSASVLVLQEKRAQLTPVQAAIAPFPGNITGVLTPTFHLSAAPLAPPVQAMYLQIDTWQGPWIAAASNGGGQFTATLTTPLQPGVHIAYAWADPQDDPPATGFQNQISATPIISNLAAYVFLVLPAPSSTALALTTGSNPSVYGQSLSFTATASGGAGTPTGTVAFLDGSTLLGTPSLNGSGQATLTTTTLSAGPHAITAIYEGNPVYGSSSSSTLNQVVNQATTTVQLTGPANSTSIYGQTVTFNVTVHPQLAGTASGTVTFYDGSTSLGTATLNGSGAASFNPSTILTLGSHSITAAYAGDANFTGSTSSVLTLTVTQASSSVAVALTMGANPSKFGLALTFTATVSPQFAGAPTGQVTFKDGSVVLGIHALNNNGKASLTTITLGTGAHSITAFYTGDQNFTSSDSSSAPLGQTINTNTGTSLSLALTTAPTITPRTALFRKIITFTATATPSAATGTVSFLDGTTLLGTAALTGGVASITARLGPGTHFIAVSYSGDSTYKTTAFIVTMSCSPRPH